MPVSDKCFVSKEKKRTQQHKNILLSHLLPPDVKLTSRKGAVERVK